MRLSRFFYTTLAILSFTFITLGQNEPYKLPDSLKRRSLNELIQHNWGWQDVKLTQLVVSEAKKKERLVTLADAYFQMFYLGKKEQALFYLDSIIGLKDRFQNKVHPAQAYFWKGKYFFNTRDFQKSSDNFIEAHKYAYQNNNQEIIYFSKHSLAALKEEIGDVKEALDIHKQNLEYINIHKKTTITEKDQLRTFFSIIRSHNRLKEVDSSYHYLDIAIPKAIRSEEDTDIEYNDLVLASAETHFISENHKQSVDSLLKVKPYYEAVNDPTALSETNYFLAQNYLKNNKEREAIPLLKSVDTLFQKHNDIRAKVRESYILLKEYYMRKEDYKNQLVYTDKLIALKDTIHQNEVYLNKKITNEYSIPVLMASRDNLIKKLEQKTRFSDFKLYGAILLIILTSTILFFINAKRKLYKKRFEALIKKEEDTAEEKATTLKVQKEEVREINIPEDVIKKILDGLDDFEKNKSFLETALSINQLAKNLGTNPNYLSKTINHFKKSSFSQYMNHLRIDYCVQQLKIDPLYRKFTIKAIAQEFGFNTSESFSKAFYAKNGIKPSYFIKNIEDYESAS